MGNVLEGLRGEGRNKEGARFRRRNTARAQIEDEILLEVSGGRAMAAGDIVGIDLELGLGVELRRGREQKTMARLLAVRLLGAALDDDLALEDAASLLVEDAFEDLAARAAGNAMIDDQARVAVLAAAKEISAGDLGIGVLALEGDEALLPCGGSSHGDGAITKDGALFEADLEVGQVNGIPALALQLDPIESRTGGEKNFGDRIVDIGRAFRAQMSLDDAGGSPIFDEDDDAARQRAGLARGDN